MERFVRQLGRDSVVYGIGGALAKSIGFFLLPLFTRIFSPTEYGRIEMALLISTFVTLILDTGMDSAQSFYFSEQKANGPAEQARVVSAIGQWRMTGGLLVALIALAFWPVLNTVFFDGTFRFEHFAAVIVGSWFVPQMTQSAELFRLLYKPWSFIGITLTNTTLFAILAVLFTVQFGLGIFGYFLGFAIAAVVSALIGWWRIRKYVDFSRLHTDWWPRILRFGVPLVPASVAMYILSSADRWFVSYFRGDASLGVFAIAVRFAGVLLALVLTFRQAVWPIIMDVIHTAHGPAFLRGAARLFLGVSVAGVVALTAVSPIVVRVFVAPAFADAYPLIGILSWQAVFYGLYLIVSAGIWKKEKTVWAPFVMGAAVVANVIVAVLLIPRYGNFGAAIATATSFFVWNLLTLIVSEKLWPVDYPISILALQVALGAAGMIWLIRLQLAGGALWGIAAITSASILAILIVTFTREELEWLVRTMRSLRVSPAERA